LTESEGRLMNSVEFAKTMADETRQKIMSLVCCRWMSVGDIVEALGEVTQPTVSHHLSVLKDVKLVLVRPEGKQTYYTLNQEEVALCCGRLIRRFAPESEAAQTIPEE
jgi:ArsR family transcriptional regulator, arsenate/arsenite/antimonite-responsive transcriptional repressor